MLQSKNLWNIIFYRICALLCRQSWPAAMRADCSRTLSSCSSAGSFPGLSLLSSTLILSFSRASSFTSSSIYSRSGIGRLKKCSFPTLPTLSTTKTSIFTIICALPYSKCLHKRTKSFKTCQHGTITPETAKFG